MAFEMSKRTYGRRRRNVPPLVRIDRSGCSFNRMAMDVIGRDKKALLLYHDDESNPPQLGFWFFKDKVTAKMPEYAYALVHYPDGTARVTCSAWIRDRELMKAVKRVGKSAFLILLDKDWETGGEFYRAVLA